MSYAFGNRKSPHGGLNEAQWASLRPLWRQVHGVSLAEVTRSNQECGEVDGLWTRTPGLPIAVVTADCVPILLEHQSGTAVAALHAGWRGTYAGIIESFFSHLPEDLASPSAWTAHIGPSIHACCYQVSPELMSDFKTRFPDIDAGFIEPAPRMLDLIAVNQSVLRKLGVRVGSVHPDCTFCKIQGSEPLYYSYRRGDRNSRQYSWIKIDSKI